MSESLKAASNKVLHVPPGQVDDLLLHPGFYSSKAVLNRFAFLMEIFFY